MIKLDPNNYDPKVIKMLRSLIAQENGIKSVKAQKKKHGKKYKDEMGRRGRMGGRPRKKPVK